MSNLQIRGNEPMACPCCDKWQSQPAHSYVGVLTNQVFETECEICSEPFTCWRINERTIEVSSVGFVEVGDTYGEETPLLLPGQSNTIGFGSKTVSNKVTPRYIKWKTFTIVLVGLGLALLQPWERPTHKVKDEYRACKVDYERSCSYAGEPYHTNQIEMGLSELIYGHVNLCRLRTPQNKC